MSLLGTSFGKKTGLVSNSFFGKNNENQTLGKGSSLGRKFAKYKSTIPVFLTLSPSLSISVFSLYSAKSDLLSALRDEE